MTVQIIALSAAIAYALSFVLSKRGFKNSTPVTITFVSLLIQTVTLSTLALTITGIPSVTPFVFLLFAIAGVLQAVVRMLTYIGIEKIGAARSGERTDRDGIGRERLHCLRYVPKSGPIIHPGRAPIIRSNRRPKCVSAE